MKAFARQIGIEREEEIEKRDQRSGVDWKTNSDTSFNVKIDKDRPSSQTVRLRRRSISGESKIGSLKRALSLKKHGQVEAHKPRNRPGTSSSNQDHLMSTGRLRAERSHSASRVAPDKVTRESQDYHEVGDSLLEDRTGEALQFKQQAFVPKERETSRQAPSRSNSSSPQKPQPSILGVEVTQTNKGHDTKQLQELTETVAKLKNDLVLKEQEIKKLQHDLKEADDDLQNMKLESIYQVSDDHLRELWGALRYKIQSHTNQRFKYKPIAPTSEFFLDFTSQASEYMLHETTRKKLFEAVIWRFIVKHIFSLDGLVWAGPAQDGFKNLSKNLVACVRDGSISWEDYHAWRARSAGMLLRAYPDDFTRKFEEEESPLEMLMIELEQILQPFQILGYDEDANPNTFDILKDAINIDVQLRQSRADYWIYLYHPIEHHGFDYDFRQAPGNEFRQIPNGKPYGFEFNSTLMDRENGASGQGAKILQVQLVVSPTVIKRGTANGDQYDHHTVIVKGVVLCNNIRSRVDATSSVFV